MFLVEYFRRVGPIMNQHTSLHTLVCGTHIGVCNSAARRDLDGNPATKTQARSTRVASGRLVVSALLRARSIFEDPPPSPSSRHMWARERKKERVTCERMTLVPPTACRAAVRSRVSGVHVHCVRDLWSWHDCKPSAGGVGQSSCSNAGMQWAGTERASPFQSTRSQYLSTTR